MKTSRSQRLVYLWQPATDSLVVFRGIFLLSSRVLSGILLAEFLLSIGELTAVR